MARPSRNHSPRSSRKRCTAAARRSSKAAYTALDELLADVRRDPQNVRARLALGTSYLVHNLHERIPGALEPLETQYPFADDRARIQYDRLLSFGYATTRQFNLAERVAMRGNQFCPDSVDFYFILAFVAMSMGEHKRALDAGNAYLSALERHDQGVRSEGDYAATPPHRSQLLNIIGSVYMDTNRLAEAVAPFEQAIDLDRGNYLPYLNLARVLARMGNRQRARSVVERGLTNCRQIQELQMLASELLDRTTVSACMIVKDEEELLPGCLHSIRDWVDEIIIVDTGSTDRTVEIAQSFGARIFHQPWEGDFSKHRNYSIEQATCDWILIIDADEEMVSEDVPKLRPLLADEHFDVICLDVFNVYTDKPDQLTFLPSMRLFRRRLNLRYEGIVHNQLHVPSHARIARIGVKIKHYGYGLSREKMRRKVQRSQALLEKQLSQNPDDPFALFNYAQLLRGKDEFSREDADKILHAASRVVELTDPTERSRRHLHLMALDQLSWCNFKLQRYGEALSACDQALAIRADYLDALLIRGHILSTMHRLDEARQTYLRYLEVQAAYDPSKEHDPLILQQVDSRTTAYYSLALLAHEQGNTAEEKRYLLEASRLTEGYLNTSLRLGQILLSESNLEEAERHFQIQHRKGREVVSALLGLAQIATRRGDLSQAERRYQEILENEPANLTARLHLIGILREAGRYDQAIALLDQARSLESLSCTDHCAIAQGFFDFGRYREAADQYRRIVESGEADSGVYNDLANCYFKLEEFDQAELFYREALRLRPDDYSANRNLGLTLARSHRESEAIALLAQALNKSPDSAELIHTVGDLYRRTGQPHKALPYYERFLSLEPTDTLALYHLSECYLTMGHTDSAKMGYRRILQIDPGFRPAQQRLAALAETVSGLATFG